MCHNILTNYFQNIIETVLLTTLKKKCNKLSIRNVLFGQIMSTNMLLAWVKLLLDWICFNTVRVGPCNIENDVRFLKLLELVKYLTPILRKDQHINKEVRKRKILEFGN